MTNYNHGAFDHWYNSDRLAESRSRLASDFSTGEQVRKEKRLSGSKARCTSTRPRCLFQKITGQFSKACA